MTTVTIGSLVIPDKPSRGIGFWFDTLTDWYTIPGSKIAVTSRPQAHGAFRILQDWREAAVVSVAGHYGGHTNADVINAVDQLHAIAGGAPVTMTVADDVRSTSREVSVRDISVPDHRGRPVVDFTIDMVAPDPRRYGAQVTTTTGLPVAGGGLAFPITFPITFAAGGSDGRVTATNPGTADTYPLLGVSGGLDGGFTLTEVGSGKQITLARAIPAGSTVWVDPRTGRAYIDQPGNDVTGFLTAATWWSIPPGGQSVIQFNGLGTVTGTPTLTARTAPAYW